MAVRIRMKMMGRSHQPFFRVCAIDKKSPRHGRVLEELGTYDPMIKDTDARALLKAERVDYWLSVGAQPSERCAVLIKKYGTNGTHVAAQKSALEKLAQPRSIPEFGAPASLPKPKKGSEPQAPAAEEAEATNSEPTPTDTDTVTVEAGASAEDATAETPPAETSTAEQTA